MTYYPAHALCMAYVDAYAQGYFQLSGHEVARAREGILDLGTGKVVVGPCRAKGLQLVYSPKDKEKLMLSS